MKKLRLSIAALALACAGTASAQANRVELTWMSIANWDMRINGTRVMMDAYISRIPQSLFVAPPGLPNDPYAYTKAAAGVDLDAIRKVRDAVLGNDKLDLLLVGHSHWDHSWDTPAWSRLTGAPMVGGQSSCLQAQAQGVPAAQCRSVSGGEKIVVAEGITMRVVRWNHSGDTTNPIQHFARELYRPPVPDANGGLRAGVGEDYPNGGGNRAYLFTVERGGEQLSFFVNNSASAFDLDKPVIVDGVDYGAPIDNLRAAMKDAGLTSVDAWIGTGGEPVAKMVVPVLRPRAYIPSHWDGLFNPFWAGIPYPFKDEPLAAYLKAQNVPLLPQKQYFDSYVLTKAGVQMEPNLAVKQKLGFAAEQKFSKVVLDAVRNVASTRDGDECGEGFDPGTWGSAFAQLPAAPRD